MGTQVKDTKDTTKAATQKVVAQTNGKQSHPQHTPKTREQLQDLLTNSRKKRKNLQTSHKQLYRAHVNTLYMLKKAEERSTVAWWKVDQLETENASLRSKIATLQAANEAKGH